MPGSPLPAARLRYQRAAVKCIDMAQSGWDSIGPGLNRAGAQSGRGAGARACLEAGHRRPKAERERGRT